MSIQNAQTFWTITTNLPQKYEERRIIGKGIRLNEKQFQYTTEMTVIYCFEYGLKWRKRITVENIPRERNKNIKQYNLFRGVWSKSVRTEQ